MQSAKYPAYSCKIPLSPRKLRNADRIHKPKDPYVGHHSFREAVMPLLLLDLLSCGRKNWVIAIVIAGRECVCVCLYLNVVCMYVDDNKKKKHSQTIVHTYTRKERDLDENAKFHRASYD